MKRKVIQLAEKTLVVSLPTTWTTRNEVKKGHEVIISEKESSLIVTAEKRVLKKKKHLIDSSFTKRYIADLYKKGYDEIHVTYKDPEIKNVIKKIDLLGFEVVEHGEDFAIIKSISQELESEFDTMLRRSILVIKEMSKIILSYTKGGKADFDEIKDLEAMNNKYTDFCIRLLNKYGYKDHDKMPYLYVIIREFEALGDHYKYLVADNVERLPVFEKVHAALEEFYNLFYKYTDEKLVTLQANNRILEKELKSLLAKHPSTVHHLLNIQLGIRNLIGPIITIK